MRPAARGRCPLAGAAALLAGAAALLAGTAALLAGACDGADEVYLRGSLTDLYDVGFDEVRVRRYASEVSVEYVDREDGQERIALRVTVDPGPGGVVAGEAYDLAAAGSVTQGAGYGAAFPDLASGEIVFEDYADEDGARVRGDFDALLEDDGGSQLTLSGGFAAKLEVVEL